MATETEQRREMIEEIRRRAEDASVDPREMWRSEIKDYDETFVMHARADVRFLLSELEAAHRDRERLRDLLLRTAPRVAYNESGHGRCSFCLEYFHDMGGGTHSADCVVPQVKAVLDAAKERS